MITLLHIGNHIDESANEEKIARQQESCTERNRVNCFKCTFFPKLRSGPWHYLFFQMNPSNFR